MDVDRNRSGCNATDSEPELDNRYSGPIGVIAGLRDDYRPRDLFSAHRRWHRVGTLLGLPIYVVIGSFSASRRRTASAAQTGASR